MKANTKKSISSAPTSEQENQAFRGRYSRRIRAKLAAEGVAFVCRDLGFRNELSHFIPDACSKVPHVAVSLLGGQKTQRTLF